MAVAYSAADPEPRISMALLEQAAAAQLDDTLGERVRTVFPGHPLEDLILPADHLLQIKDMIAACHSWPHVTGRRGVGSRFATGACITGLFHGAPGTGKSFAAEVIASVLGQPLHIVDLSSVLGQQLSEAQRDLRELFERARRKPSLLLFDDAVPAAQDHAMTARTGLFLQELDRHAGLVIVTTHLTERIDPALARRMLFCLAFSPPDEDARRRIWQRLLPGPTPCAPDVDLAALARSYVLSGGEIKHAVLRASLAAYADGGEVTQRHLTEACEHQGARRPGRDPTARARIDRTE
jgi:SpoVK/Ycf46/Vps4 family AAA+-type ATPase